MLSNQIGFTYQKNILQQMSENKSFTSMLLLHGIRTVLTRLSKHLVSCVRVCKYLTHFILLDYLRLLAAHDKHLPFKRNGHTHAHVDVNAATKPFDWCSSRCLLFICRFVHSIIQRYFCHSRTPHTPFRSTLILSLAYVETV